ncbi:MAG: hypothetical protein Q4G53_05425 [Clostridia bacterium]|nr:hypothetical protein [Clostridia bacterium]
MADKYTPERATNGKEWLRTWWKKVENNFVKIFGAVSKHIDGTADRHTADMIDYSDTETVKAKLDSTDTKLDTKVDKVSGKSLIDSGVAGSLHKQAGGIVYNASKDAFTVGDVSDGGSVMSDMNGNVTYTFGSYAKITSYDVEVKKARHLAHRLSEKANTSDVFLKSGDVVLAKGKIIKVTKDGESTANDGSKENIQIRGDAMFIRANDVEPYGLMLSKDGIVLDTDNNENVNIKSGEITVYKKDSTGNSVAHKLTEKMSVSDLESYLLNGGQKSIIGDLYVSGGESSTNDITLWRVENNEPVTHKLSEKANAADVGSLLDLTTTDKSSVVAAINEVKSSGGGDVLDNLTYDSTNDIINSSANLLLENSASVAAYNGTFRGDIKIGQLGANKWAYRISPITGFSTSVDVTCTAGNKIHSLANKADSNDVLTKTNTAAFTPTGDYQPATKKYVDDTIKAAIEKYNTEAMALLGED